MNKKPFFVHLRITLLVLGQTLGINALSLRPIHPWLRDGFPCTQPLYRGLKLLFRSSHFSPLAFPLELQRCQFNIFKN